MSHVALICLGNKTLISWVLYTLPLKCHLEFLKVYSCHFLSLLFKGCAHLLPGKHVMDIKTTPRHSDDYLTSQWLLPQGYSSFLSSYSCGPPAWPIGVSVSLERQGPWMDERTSYASCCWRGGRREAVCIFHCGEGGRREAPWGPQISAVTKYTHLSVIP